MKYSFHILVFALLFINVGSIFGLMHQTYLIKTSDAETITFTKDELSRFTTLESFIKDLEESNINTQPPNIALDLADLPVQIRLDAETITILKNKIADLLANQNINWRDMLQTDIREGFMGPLFIVSDLALNLLRTADYLALPLEIRYKLAQFSWTAYNSNKRLQVTEYDIAHINEILNEWYWTKNEIPIYPTTPIKTVTGTTFMLRPGPFSIKDYLAHGWTFSLKESAEGGADLDLKNKFLDSLEGIELIPNIEKVVLLDLENNLFTNLSADQFKLMPNLKLLYLKKNLCRDIDDKAFTGLSKLEILDLDFNNLNEIDSTCFTPLISLKNLYITNNNLHHISEFPTNLNKLQILILSENRLKDFGTGIFFNLKNLVMLRLDNNHLTHVSNNYFIGLLNLKTLSFEHNKIAFIEEEAFSDLSKLDEINLSKNELTVLPENIFAYNPDLKVIYLNNNKLTTLSISLFKNITGLNTLEIKNNNLSPETVQILAKELIHKYEGTTTIGTDIPLDIPWYQQ